LWHLNDVIAGEVEIFPIAQAEHRNPNSHKGIVEDAISLVRFQFSSSIHSTATDTLEAREAWEHQAKAIMGHSFHPDSTYRSYGPSEKLRVSWKLCLPADLAVVCAQEFPANPNYSSRWTPAVHLCILPPV